MLSRFYEDHDTLNLEVINDGEIKAYSRISIDHEWDEAGTITVENGWLQDIKVNKGYRRNGIGTGLIAKAIDELNLSKIPYVKYSSKYEYCLTEKGEVLIATCIKKGIIIKRMCFKSFSTAELLREGCDDPGMDSSIINRALTYQNRNQPPITHWFKKIIKYHKGFLLGDNCKLTKRQIHNALVKISFYGSII